MSRLAFRDRVAQYFRDHPHTWIDSRELERVGGRMAWRTRCSECRTVYGMHIDNRVRRVKAADGSKYTVSEYRFVPPTGQLALWGAAQTPGEGNTECRG